MLITFEEFKHKFSEAIEDNSIISLDEDADFRDLESWDSFSVMSLIAMIDNDFGLTIKPNEITNAKSFRELYNLIITNKSKC
jgi:acyl carrier protein